MLFDGWWFYLFPLQFTFSAFFCNTFFLGEQLLPSPSAFIFIPFVFSTFFSLLIFLPAFLFMVTSCHLFPHLSFLLILHFCVSLFSVTIAYFILFYFVCFSFPFFLYILLFSFLATINYAVWWGQRLLRPLSDRTLRS
ncbi:hypothetical protein L873DRAFT_913877 [Choiromyces venosus 120613-1]|uniref:Uncharacterized protein n=1 Tax=Choiromyces venosus 120613-1 TaxID=1336337 RepID=A0A3N4IWI8_9PEZI|nr:hypothetical protein L873DRAFT_913877 [Choiromyces venosus 120613-1]